MPVKRDADGNIIEEKTERAASFGREARPEDGTAPMRPEAGRQPTSDEGLRADSSQQSGYEARTVVARSKSADNPAQKAPESGYDAPSVPARDAPVGKPAPPDEVPERRTRIYRPGGQKSSAPERPPEQPVGPDGTVRPPTSGAMDDPPVGWLVVVQGPGQGNVVTIGIGSNSLGRDPSERICVDFGDETISRHGHTIITYDPRGKKFYIQHGGGKNLTYVEESPVLAPTELDGFSKIQIGETLLLFVPLCGERFDWAEYAE